MNRKKRETVADPRADFFAQADQCSARISIACFAWFQFNTDLVGGLGRGGVALALFVDKQRIGYLSYLLEVFFSNCATSACLQSVPVLSLPDPLTRAVVWFRSAIRVFLLFYNDENDVFSSPSPPPPPRKPLPWPDSSSLCSPPSQAAEPWRRASLPFAPHVRRLRPVMSAVVPSHVAPPPKSRDRPSRSRLVGTSRFVRSRRDAQRPREFERPGGPGGRH